MDLTPEQEAQLEALERQESERRGPIWQDEHPFAVWLRRQRNRRDQIGALARTASQDPMWPGYQNRQQIQKHFRDFGVPAYIVNLLGQALNEFERQDSALRAKARDAHRKSQERKARKELAKIRRGPKPKKKRKR